jgi:formate/nitrite transporter FocA (FNT family)
MLDWLRNAWEYLKEHDASNWFVIIISLIIWPAALSLVAYWSSNRRTQSVPHFLVTFTPTKITIGHASYAAVMLTFINQTGSIYTCLCPIWKHGSCARPAAREVPTLRPDFNWSGVPVATMGYR